MKYCVPYSKNFKYINEINEIIIEYDSKKNTDLIKLLLMNKDVEYLQNKRLIISVQDFSFYQKWNTTESLKELKQKAENFNLAVMFKNFNLETMESEIKNLKDAKIPFFFDLKVSNWDIFNGLIKLGVSDIYIVEELGFELNLAGPVAHAAEVSIRVFANVCQSSWNEEDSLKSFFIRPEGVIEYELYVDVIEFLCKNTKQQEVYYKIYAKDKKWFGNLQEIIIGLDTKIDSRFLIPTFDRIRTKCGKKCIKGKTCNICSRVIDVAETFEEKGFMIKY